MTEYEPEFSSDPIKSDQSKSDQSKSDQSKSEFPTYITRVRLMDQGTFGCIYRPEIECETGNAGDYAYVSKVQKMTRTIQNEIEIGNLIKQIPHYMFWYSPLLKTCPIYFSTLKKYEEQGESCKAIKDSLTKNTSSNETPTPNTQFISSKIRHAGKYIIDYLRMLPPNICAKKIISTYDYLDTAIARLNKHGIIHSDIKENNVLYDTYNHSPNIIDFGISYKIADLGDESKEKTIFYTTKFYPYWCIHVHLLCVGVGKRTVFSGQSPPASTSPATLSLTSPITEDALASVYESYMSEFAKFAQENELNRILNEQDFIKHKESYWAYMTPYIGKTWETDLRPALLKTHLHWDKYSLAIMYMTMISKMPDIAVDPAFIAKLRNRFSEITE